MAYRIDRKTEIVIGHEGENNARRVTFDVSGYPEGTVILEHLRYGSAFPYPITLDRDGDVAAWTITDVDTSRRGTGRGQLVVIDADKNIVYKSDVFKVINRFSLSSTDAPDGWESWIERLELMLRLMTKLMLKLKTKLTKKLMLKLTTKLKKKPMIKLMLRLMTKLKKKPT